MKAPQQQKAKNSLSLNVSPKDKPCPGGATIIGVKAQRVSTKNSQRRHRTPRPFNAGPPRNRSTAAVRQIKNEALCSPRRRHVADRQCGVTADCLGEVVACGQVDVVGPHGDTDFTRASECRRVCGNNVEHRRTRGVGVIGGVGAVVVDVGARVVLVCDAVQLLVAYVGPHAPVTVVTQQTGV